MNKAEMNYYTVHANPIDGKFLKTTNNSEI
jgi:hypothetical protein